MAKYLWFTEYCFGRHSGRILPTRIFCRNTFGHFGWFRSLTEYSVTLFHCENVLFMKGILRYLVVKVLWLTASPAAPCQCIFCWIPNITVFGWIFSVVRVRNVLYITEYSVYAEHSVFGRIFWSFSDQNIWVPTETKISVLVNHCSREGWIRISEYWTFLEIVCE